MAKQEHRIATIRANSKKEKTRLKYEKIKAEKLAVVLILGNTRRIGWLHHKKLRVKRMGAKISDKYITRINTTALTALGRVLRTRLCYRRYMRK